MKSALEPLGANNADEVTLMPIAKKPQVAEDQRIFPELPEWLHRIAPKAEGEEAVLLATAWSQYHEELSRRVQRFVDGALKGVACRVAEVSGSGSKCACASFFLDPGLTTLTLQDRLENGALRKRHFWLADLRNLLVCADSELARRVHRSLSPYAVPEEALLSCLVLLDGAAAPAALVLPSAEAREEFLDCMGVLIAAHRTRQETAAEQPPLWLPQPEVAGLRPPNFSLRSGHLSGPLAAWLGSCAPMPPLRPPEAPVVPPRRRHSDRTAEEVQATVAKASAKSRIRTRSLSVGHAHPGRGYEEETQDWPVPSKE